MNFTFFQGNYIDLIIILAIGFFLWQAWESGFWAVFIELVALVGSFIFASWGYKYGATFLRKNFSVSASLSNAISFLLFALIAESLLSYIMLSLVNRIPKKYREGKIYSILSLIPGLIQALLVIAFSLSIFLGFPILPNVKQDIVSSEIGGYLVKQSSFFENRVKEVFGGIIEDSITYFTIEPKSNETVHLTISSHNLTIDSVSENQMFDLVNQERAKAGVHTLSWDTRLMEVARGHARDMWVRNYFSHYSPEGKDVGDRLTEANISYEIAGENLALAPTLATAHQGLMNSPGHRANILDTRFNKVGIGVIDNGVYGKMFVQVFTN